MKSTIRRIIREEMDDFEWIKNTSHVSAEEGNNFILIADVIEDLPCKPQEMMFKAGYRWAGDIPSVHGDPLKCKDKGIHNKPYVLIPQQGAVNYYNGYRKFGMVGWMNREGGTKFMRDYIKKWNPTIILWSDVVNKEPDFVLDMDNSINEQDDFEWIRNEEVYYPINNINELKIGQKYYIDYRVGYDNEQLNLPVVFRSYPTRGASSYQFVGEGKDGKLRNYLFFRHSTGEGLQDMIDKGKVKYKKSELKEQDDFEWAGGMIDPFDYGKYLRLVFFVDGDKIEWTESKLKEVGYKESPHVNKYKERLRGSDRVAFIVNKAHNVLHFEDEKTYEITSVEEAKKKVRWLSAGDNSRFTMTIIDNPFNV